MEYKAVGYYNDFAEKLADKINEEFKNGWVVSNVITYDNASVVIIYTR